MYGKPCPQSYSQVSASHAFVSPSSILPDPFFSLQSVAYTAVPLFVMAVVWFVGFGAVLLIISCCCCFCGGKDGAYSPCCYFTSLAFLIILTIATM